MKSLFKIGVITFLLGFSSLSIAQFECTILNRLSAISAEEENAMKQWQDKNCEWQETSCTNIVYAQEKVKVCNKEFVSKTSTDKNDS